MNKLNKIGEERTSLSNTMINRQFFSEIAIKEKKAQALEDR